MVHSHSATGLVLYDSYHTNQKAKEDKQEENNIIYKISVRISQVSISPFSNIPGNELPLAYMP
jgi:hypothetical protein